LIVLRKINAHIRIAQLDLSAFSKDQGLEQKREIERAGTQFLLKELLKTEDFKLCYSEVNKPYLQARKEHISISHSHDKLVIILNENETTGIDIELIRDKVINIQHKFLSVKELDYAANHVEKLITIWAAKEAIYKAYGSKELEFINHIYIQNWEGDKISGEIRLNSDQKKYELKVETIDNYKMVYLLNEL